MHQANQAQTGQKTHERDAAIQIGGGGQENAGVKSHNLNVGDVLMASWGYEQTNIDYYEVTRLVGRHSVEIREIARQSQGTHWLQGECVPVKGRYVGEPIIKRVRSDGLSVKIFSWGAWARKKESRIVGGVEVFSPDHWTAYA
ncbi:MAG: hypothetical protein LBI87_00860 [Candidatus Accumulibacter sp.]|jgi:hypothetical protein|nr:hypothetical protein [Accumulibacter sp.]